MPRPLKKIALVVEEFTVPSPAQQLLDRFLIGYPRDGKFYHPDGCRVAAHLLPGSSDAELNRRVTDFGLLASASLEKTVTDADAIIVAWRGNGTIANDQTLRQTLNLARPGAHCFVHGTLANDVKVAQEMVQLAATRSVRLYAGTPYGVTWRLPQIDLPANTVAKDALVVVQGPTSGALFEGLECILPVIEKRRRGEPGIQRIRAWEGTDVWKAGDKRDWSWPLLAAAISRSNSPQGDPVADGRTQDLIGLGLVPKLATSPRAWQLQHRDGLRTTILALDGVVADYNFAVQDDRGHLHSAQVYCPPAPAQHAFSRLTEVLEDSFRNDSAPWSLDRGILIAGLLEQFNSMTAKPGEWMKVAAQ